MSLRTLLENTHSYLPKLAQQFKDGKVNRREFLRTATLLGLSSAAAYSIVGLPESGGLTKSARAAGGTVRISMRVQPIASPHTYSWIQDSMMARKTAGGAGEGASRHGGHGRPQRKNPHL